MLLDLRTLMVAAFAASVMAAAMLFIMTRLRFAVRGATWWAVGTSLMSLSLFFLAVRGFIAPWTSILLGNTCSIYGNAMMWTGVRRFAGREPKRWALWALPAAWPVVLAFFTFVEPSLRLRSLAMSAGMVLFGGLTAWELLRQRGCKGRLGRRFVASLNILYALFFLIYGMFSLFVYGTEESFMRNAPLQAIMGFFVLMSFTVYTAALVLMVGEALQEKLNLQAAYDQLTGVLTRRAFFMLARREAQRCRRLGQPLALLMLDLDHFKRVNDAHGHIVGDAVLRQFANRLGAELREQDLLCRYGGEEFLVLLPETGQEGALGLASRLCGRIAEQPFVHGERQLRITVSVGVAAEDPPADDLTALIHRADQALYQSKDGGRNRVCAAGPLSPAQPNAAKGRPAA